MRSNRTADVASTRLCFSEVTVIYREVAPTALLKSEMRTSQRSTFSITCWNSGQLRKRDSVLASGLYLAVLSRNHAMEIERKDAEPQRRKGERHEWIPDQRSPFGDRDRQCQFLLCAFAPLRLCVQIPLPYCLDTA